MCSWEKKIAEETLGGSLCKLGVCGLVNIWREEKKEYGMEYER